jgi:hypothetical protein
VHSRCVFLALNGGFVGEAGVVGVAGSVRAETEITSFERTGYREKRFMVETFGGLLEGWIDDVVHGRAGWTISGAHSGSEGDSQTPFGPLTGRIRPGEHDKKRNVYRNDLHLSSTPHLHQNTHRALIQQLIGQDKTSWDSESWRTVPHLVSPKCFLEGDITDGTLSGGLQLANLRLCYCGVVWSSHLCKCIALFVVGCLQQR